MKELGPGEVLEEKPMTVDEQDDSSVAQQNSALAMLRSGNVSIIHTGFESISLCLICLCMHVFIAGCMCFLSNCLYGLANFFGLLMFLQCTDMLQKWHPLKPLIPEGTFQNSWQKKNSE